MFSRSRSQNEVDTAPALVADRGWFGGMVQQVTRSLCGARGPQKRSLRHVETLALGPKRTVFLIECEGQRFLLADGMSAPVPLTQHFAAAVRTDRC